MKKISLILIAVMLMAVMAISASAATFEAAKGTPVIDAEMDEAYSVAKDIPVAFVVDNKPDAATGMAKVLWDADALYVYIAVKDKVLSTKKATVETDVWHTDSAEVYLDFVNTGDDDVTTINAGQYTAGLAYNGDLWGGRGMHWDANKANSTYKTKKIDGGWAVEMKIAWGSDYKAAENNVIGFTIALNDDADDADGRENQAFISEGQTNSWSMTGSYDDLKLTNAEFVPVVEIVEAPVVDTPAPVTTTAPAPVKAAQTSDMGIIIALTTLLTSGAAIIVSKKRK